MRFFRKIRKTHTTNIFVRRKIGCSILRNQ
nr:MAG TPA: hypothetical protein [Caudoviricetes sp.]DAZ40161.1 MAG TPA: hypothetical protein [Caudoviricetes sp.]